MNPFVYVGGLSVDDRGSVSFVNDFNPFACGVKRFYTVKNHAKGFVRAWHGHMKEAKYVYVPVGAVLVGTVDLTKAEDAAHDPCVTWVLSSESPQILFIPPGFANGFKTLTENAVVVFFSTATLEESLEDDIRFDARKWNPWDAKER